jgi:hypothetical protein
VNVNVDAHVDVDVLVNVVAHVDVIVDGRAHSEEPERTSVTARREHRFQI